MTNKRNAAVGATIPRIRSPGSYEAGQWDLDIFGGCFGERATAFTDGDGMAEHHGHVIFFEFKAPGAKVTLGQDLLFRVLSKHPNQVVLVVEGSRNRPERFCRWTVYGEGAWELCTLESLRARIKVWAVRVERKARL